MKLLLLLLPVCASAFFLPDHLGNKVADKGKELHHVGKLTEEEKSKLSQEWGIDLDARKARFNRMSEKVADSLRQNPTSHAGFQNLLKAIVPIAITKPSEDSVTDILEVNKRAGLSEYLFEGDIILSEDQLDALENDMSTSRRRKRQAGKFVKKWPNNTLYFYFDDSIDQSMKDTVKSAQEYIQERTCINFVESKTAKNRVKVYNGGKCFSESGMRRAEKEQTLSLTKGCQDIGSAAHEFAHALGFMHSQSRPDRDNFVAVNLSDVNKMEYTNFGKQQSWATLLYTPYEYGSFLHYSANAFVNTPGSFSILPKDGNFTYTIGNGQITFYDMLMINLFYKCNETCTTENSAVCQNGGYPNPRNCSVCNCPRGYGGILCNERPPGCGETLEATEEWQFYRVRVGNSTVKRRNDIFMTCNHWITAPEEKKIQVQIGNIFNGMCGYGCKLNGIEIKANANKNITNPLYCCEEFNNRIITSDLNPTPLASYNRIGHSYFDIEYRFVEADGTTSKPKKTSTTTTPASGVTNTGSTSKPTPPAPTLPCSNRPSVKFVKRLYNDNLVRNHYHSSSQIVKNWVSQGYKEIGNIGRVMDSNLCQPAENSLKRQCPSIVKLRAFISSKGVEFMTIDDAVAQTYITNGWQEIESVGYCSSKKACGASKNLRSVTAKDGNNIVYSIFDAELNEQNKSSRYSGSLSSTICWLF